MLASTLAFHVSPFALARAPAHVTRSCGFCVKVAWWEREDVQRFLRAIDRSGYMHEYRWGDAPIQTAALHMFAARRPVYTAVEYTHISTENEVGSTNTSDEGIEIKFQKPKELTRPPATFTRLELLFHGCYQPCAVANHFRLPGAPFLDEPNATRALKQQLRARYNQSSAAVHSLIDAMQPSYLAEIWQFDVEVSPPRARRPSTRPEPRPPRALSPALRART